MLLLTKIVTFGSILKTFKLNIKYKIKFCLNHFVEYLRYSGFMALESWILALKGRPTLKILLMLKELFKPKTFIPDFFAVFKIQL
jgi:hypothetical protein